MSEMSTIGSMPWLNRFIARVTRSTLPVRSPWPKRQPSTRSAPAIIASSVAATAVPRSLCGCRLITVFCAAGQLPGEPLDLVGVHVGCRHLDRGRQVEDDLAAVVGLPDVTDRLAHLDRERQLGAGEDLGAVLVADHRGVEVALDALHHGLGAADRDVLDLVLAGPEDDAAEQRGQRVVEVDVGAGYADQRLHAALDEVLAGLGQHRDGHVVGDPVALDDLADEGEVGLAGAREADLDLLVAHLHEQLEHRHLAGRAHRVDQRLVAVAEVGGQPARRPRDDGVRPGAVGQVDRRERRVAAVGHRAGLLRRDGHVVLAGCWPGQGPGLRGRSRTLTPQRGGPALAQTSLRQPRRRRRVMTRSPSRTATPGLRSCST